jgi:trafficking protein particle complex subunit 4
MYFQLFIINRYGGLVYSKSLSMQAPNLSTNDCLRLGSTFHGLHAIAQQVAPVVSAGIERLETDTFVLQCLQTLTGVKFVVTASPGTPDLEGLLLGIYDLYSDYVLKVSFFCLFQPLRVLFSNFFRRTHFLKSICPFAATCSINI